MSNKVILLIIVLLPLQLLICCRHQKPVATAFKPLPVGTGENNAGNGVQVFFKADSAQKKSGKGLQFSVKLQNDSSTSVVIRNPLDFISPSLLNEAGKDILYPYVSRILINSKGPYSPKSFDVDRIKVNDKSADIKLRQEKQITIAGNGSIEIYMSIKQVLKPGAEKPFTEDQRIPIPAGTYQLLMAMAMLEGEAKSLLRIPPVYIRYE